MKKVVVILAVATWMSACGTKSQPAVPSTKSTTVATETEKVEITEVAQKSRTELAQENLERQPWYGECGKSGWFSSITKNSERTELDFNAKTQILIISQVTYDLANCEGEPMEATVVKEMNYNVETLPRKGLVLKLKNPEKFKEYTSLGPIMEKGSLVGRYKIDLDENTVSFGKGMIGKETGVFTREATTCSGSYFCDL